MFQNETLDGRLYVVLTAYFVQPGKRQSLYLPRNKQKILTPLDTICTTGRHLSDLISEGTGNGLWFQNGPNPNTLINVPRTRSAASQLGWTDTECFPGMGLHNFFEVGSSRLSIFNR